MNQIKRMEFSGWGGFPRVTADSISPANVDELMRANARSLILRGQGRSYGDAAISKNGLVVLSERLTGTIGFDEQSGVLTAAAGTTLAQILEVFAPQGWFPAVVPGTKFVSLGGCVAADVHGKNHHRDGTFGAHTLKLDLVLANGEHRECSRNESADLFWATVGGMGLTAAIAAVSFQLVPIANAFVVVQHQRANDLEECLSMLAAKEFDDHYSVAWVDCLAPGKRLGRGVLMLGHHATTTEAAAFGRTSWPDRQQKSFKLRFFPTALLNPTSVALFNSGYFYHQSRKIEPFLEHYERFFFPLDRIANWNVMYGRRGFVQYQCVLPTEDARQALVRIFEEMQRSGRTSFLSVLKRFGAANEGFISFPLEGYTLTLDFPIIDKDLFPFLDRLDEIVLRCGGRVYLAKDARLSPERFRAMYPRFADWKKIKQQVDRHNQFSSDLGQRLEMSF